MKLFDMVANVLVPSKAKDSFFLGAQVMSRTNQLHFNSRWPSLADIAESMYNAERRSVVFSVEE
jgi:hypothetical protein